MTEYIVDVTNEEAEQFVARFGIDGVTMFGYRLAGEIVRCRDCRYYDTHTEPPECYREIPGRIVAPDGFCAWGARRDA